MNESLQTYFSSLSVNKKLEIIKTMLEKFKAIVDGKTIVLKYAGFDEEDSKKLVTSVFSNINIEKCEQASYSEKRFVGVYEGLIIEDIEKTFICRAGMEQAKQNIFDEKKQMLAKALFGESLS